MEIVNDTNFEAEVLKSDKPVLVDFFAVWCGPCRQMLPIITELAETMGNTLKVVKMDVDESEATPTKYQIQSIPTLIMFKDGQVAAQHSGAMSHSELEAWIKENV